MMTAEAQKVIINIIPLLIGGVVAAVNNAWLNGQSERFEAWTRRKQEFISKKTGWFSRYVLHPVLWMIVKMYGWTDRISHPGIRSGTRVASTLYFIWIWLSLLFAAFLIILMVVIVGVILFIVFHVMSGSKNAESSSAAVTRAQMRDGTSERKERFLGSEYVQYYDKDGNKIATEEVKEHFLGGRYIQCYNADGEEIGTKELKERFLGGAYVQQYDEQSNEAGTSEAKEPLFGQKYTQHYDNDRNKTGTSQQKEKFLGGKYVEHKPED